jgi:GDP-L-fucose synthase
MGLKGKKILVTGGNGFLGGFLIPQLKEKGAETITFSSKDYDLRKEKEVEELFIKTNPDIVIHLAVDGGGIGYMREHPGSVYYNNILMNTLVQEYSRKNNAEKFVGIGSVCSYPKFTKAPFKEEDLWKGYPEETNAPYGLAKKMMLVQSQAYREQYKFNALHLLMVNLYGPNDDFNLNSSHVIPALIRKMIEAKKENKKEVEFWGTGEVSREFLYVKDAAKGIVLATEFYNKSDPINLGSEMEIKIKDLVNKVKKIVDFDGNLIWNTKYPDGQPRRYLDVSKADKEFGFKAKTSLDEGLKETIDWYLKNK